MNLNKQSKDNRIYIVVAIFIIAVIIITFFLSTNQLISAKIDDNVLDFLWIEDINERAYGSGFLGLEKWASFTYKNNNNLFPAYVTVTSFKTIFVFNEFELKNKMEETIKNSYKQGVTIDFETKITGERTLRNGHKTLYTIYDGNYSSGLTNEKIKIIGETWNCGVSGTSIICIGYAQITNHAHNNSEINLTYWIKIIKDEKGNFGSEYKGNDGLIFNVICH
ncbi:MAG: hypothetical protein ACQXXF_00810 [Thermoplasmatota archaeon]